MRYQLLRTSPYLSGQVRWDIPLYYHYDNGEHIIDTPELHIVPLNDNLIFNEDNDRDTFHYSHLENIKYLYNRMGDDFYSAEGEWNGDKWLYNGGFMMDPFSHVFIMGTRRMRFTRYQKQFSFLCPLWISEKTDPSKFSFEISVKVADEERDHIARRVFRLSDKLCQYMGDFLDKSAKYIEPDPTEYPDINLAPYMGVTDELLSIKFDPDEAFITGVQVDAAKYTTKNISYIIDSLIYRETPMMEFDNNLLINFKENHMIAQQLINLNFVFNMEDISFFLKDSLLGNRITIMIKTKYDDEFIELKDFYTNYNEIPIYRVDLGGLSNSYNVCDYLGDDRIIDYTQVNKFTQPIFHWSMVENPNFIYNFYDGFAPAFIGGGTDLHRIQGHYYDQADISQDSSTVYNNASHWCFYNDFTSSSLTNIYSYLDVSRKPIHYKELNTKINFNPDSMIAYLNNNRYDMKKMDWDSNKDTETIDGVQCLGVGDVNIYLSIGIINQDIMDAFANPTADIGFHGGTTDDNNHYLYCVFEPILIDNTNDIVIKFFCVDESKATLHQIKDFSKYYIDNTTEYLKIFRILNYFVDSWIPPYKIEFTKSIFTNLVETVGEKHPTELNMYQDNMANGFVLRYTGRLCPLFINPNDPYYYNINYAYRQWSDINTKDVQFYNKMLKTGRNPDYPSINYYTYDKFRDMTTRPEFYDKWEGDIVWKNDGYINIMPERYITTFLESNPLPFTEQTEELKFWELLYNHIANLMGKSELSIWFKHWLKEIYQIEYNFDYPNERDVNNILYTAIFNLR